MKAKKSYGQHFLTQSAIAQRIAESLTGYGDYKHILEIGPGTGMLTQFLCQSPYQLKLIEADQDMVAYITKHFPNISEDNIISMDFLKLDLMQTWEGERFAIIGNFPYNISSQIVMKMIDYKEIVPELVGMFQKEMAERIIAKSGNKDYGIISVLTQIYYEGQMLFHVSPNNFKPPPKVQSAVIRLQRRAQPLWENDITWFKLLVKTTFNQRRKMLRNTLRPLIANDEILEESFFQMRPEQLSVEQFVELAHRLEHFRKI
ncbi:MAG: ribosomal RNA small subunit methyltransferase A [Saprospiraceae bacterium]|nr:ribosomal RNA small subunit methyltransferase A [Saprospiraceae bacterium]